MKCAYLQPTVDVHGNRKLRRCGQCLGCRIYLRKCKVTRLMSECYSHDASSFLTLTYDDQHLPPKLEYEHISLFLKRLRKNSKLKIRFYCCGELGARFGRPHWHLILFGRSPETLGSFSLKEWPMGMAYDGTVTHASLSYVSGYLKKTQVVTDTKMVQSKGIGLDLLREIGERAAQAGAEWRSVPHSFKVGGKEWPVDRVGREYIESGWLDAGGEPFQSRSYIIGELDRTLYSWFDATAIQRKLEALEVAERIKDLSK